MRMKRAELKRTPMKRTGMLRTASTQMAERGKCKHCKEPFVKRNMSHVACSPDCAIALAETQRRKDEEAELAQDRKATRVRREALKTRSDYLKEAQVAFNAYIRARDADKPCICCGRTSEKQYLTGSNWDCGHYRSTGSAPHLRFDENNAHRQLTVCNRHGAGRAVDYRIGLIARIGVAAVEALEADNAPRKWSIDELKAIKALYRAKLRELRK